MTTLRNSFYNLMGLGLPLVVAVIAIPVLIRSLGVEQFGILTIIWAVVSYFGLFDLGLGRAVTQQVATCAAAGDLARMNAVIGTSTALMWALGMIAALIMIASAALLARELTGTGDPGSVTRAFWWMAIAMPAVVLTSGYRGILEALGRFEVVNAIRLPMGILTYAGPLAVVWLGHGSLEAIAAVLSLGRIVACVVHAHYAKRCLPQEARGGGLDRALVRPLLSFGGWITVTNIVAPLMNYTDRILLGLAVSAAAVAYYATPQELVLRVGIIPTAITAVLFPIFASQATGLGTDRMRSHLARYTLIMLGLLLPLTIFLVALAHLLLAKWITPAFADQATVPLQIMAVAALCSGLAQVPFTMLQGRSRADLTAKLQLLELPLYLGLLWFLVVNYGITGAALAWLIRIAADMLALYYLCLRDLRGSAQAKSTSADPERADPFA